MLLTAAKLLKENEASLAGRVRLMFQPGEETFQGAKSMIAAGVLEDPKPDVALAYHVMAGRMPLGLVCYNRAGTMMNSSDNFTITITGRGTHGAYPDNGVDPITIAAHLILALESVVARELKATQASVLTIGKVEAGDAGNIIPQTATLCGTMRCDDPGQRAFLLERLRQVAEGTAATHRGTATVTVTSGTPPLICDTAATDDFLGYMRELPVPGYAEYPGIRAAASEDWAAVLEQIPGSYLFLSAGFPDREVAPQHHPQVVFNEGVLAIGPAYLAHCATRWLEEHH
jgi:amidohydrolase